MASSRNRWLHAEKVLKNISKNSELVHPSEIPSSKWLDDVKLWPHVSYKNIFNYLVLSEGVDGEAIENFKSMESYHYFHAGKVDTVLLNEPSPGMFFLKAHVTPSQSSKTTHLPWVLTTKDGVIETAGCSCIAGQGKSCSHTGAILWKLEYAHTQGISGSSCTDVQQKWNKGTLKNVGPRRLSDINFRRKTRSSNFTADDRPVFDEQLPNQPAYLTQEEFFAAISDEKNPVRKLFAIPGTMLYSAATAEHHQQASEAASDVQHGEHSEELVCGVCKLFFEKYVVVSPAIRAQLCTQTTDQGTVQAWHDSRSVRITGSSAKKVPVRSTTNPENFLREHMYPSFRGNNATRYGQESEPKAIKALGDLGFDISFRGTVVAEDEHWLSASPDGIADGDTLIEVKCPILENESLTSKLDTGICDLVLVGGTPQLNPKGRRGYYLQVQLTMFCTGLRKCKFFVWTERAHVLIDVSYNEAYVKKAVSRLKNFYFCVMLPRLSEDFNNGRLKLSKSYKDIFMGN